MVRVLLILSVLVLLWYVIYPTYKDGSIYYGAGDYKKDGRKSFSFGNMCKKFISFFKRSKE